MARTSINVSGVLSASSKCTTAKAKVSNAESGIESTRTSIDSKILNRNGINYRLTNVKNCVGQIEGDIAEICATINNGAMRYQATENRVVFDVNAINNEFRFNDKQIDMSEIKSFWVQFQGMIPDVDIQDKKDNAQDINENKGNISGGTSNNEDNEDKIENRKNKNASTLCEGLVSYFLDEDAANGKKILSEGIKFTTIEGTDARVYLKLDNIQGLTHAQLADKLKQYVTNAKLNDYDIRRLINDGIPLYSKNGNMLKHGKMIVGTENVEGKEVEKLFDFSGAVKNVNPAAGKFSAMKSTFDSNMKKNIVETVTQYKPSNLKTVVDFKDFSSLSKVEQAVDLTVKGGKVLGAVGDVVNVGVNVYDNMYNEKTGTWDVSAKTVTNTVTDVAIDVGTSVAAASAGAAIGSLIVPPVGTVVGAVAGVAIDVAINWEFDFDGDGKSNSLVGVIKEGVDGAVDYIGDKLGNLFGW